MLTLRAIGSSKQEVNYYAKLGAAEQHDYYAHDRAGTWWGRGAEQLGLTEDVTPQAFENLLRGFAPDGAIKLVRNAGETSRRAAFDLTFSCPKSVSVAWAHAGKQLRREIEACLARALQTVLDYFARECGVTRRGYGTHLVEQAGLIAAIFRHDTSRPVQGMLPDPNLHFHVVLTNATVRADGTTGTLDARPLYRKNMMMALGALYRAEVSRNLSELGLASHRPKKPNREERVSWFELDVVPESLLATMSKRRRVIQQRLAEQGLSGVIASERAALATRSAKTIHTRAELNAAWQQAGHEHGFSQEQLGAAIGRGTSEHDTARACFDRALVRITAERAHFSEPDVTRFAAEEAQGRGVGASEIIRVVKAELGHRYELVRLKDVLGEPRYTTRAMLALERRLVAQATQIHNRSRLAVTFAAVRDVETEFSTLRTEQRTALRHLTAAADLAVVNGIAGSGKTYLLQAARRVWEQAGLEVVGTTLAAKASRVLEEGSGIRSLHIHKLLDELTKERITLTAKSVLVIDEAGMVGTQLMAQLVAAVERAGSKLVLVGDYRQLQAISAGAPFRVLGERLGVVELHEIIRQQEPWAREVVHQFRDGEAAQALATLHERGLLTVAADRDAALERLVRDWSAGQGRDAGGTQHMIFAATNFEVDVLNAMCQAERKRLGVLSEHSIEVRGQTLHVGDRVVATKNHRGLLVQNGMFGTVTQIAGRDVKVAFDGGYQVTISVDAFDRLALGYASTTHKGQGVTTGDSYILAGGSMQDRELTYVQASRARGTTRVYCDAVSAGPELEQLAALMSRSRQKELALEHELEDAA